MSLAGKTIIITGANGALGRVVARTALEQGAATALFDLAFDDTTTGSDAARRWSVDLTDPEATERAIDEVGEFHVVFNIAGGFAMGPKVHETSREEWDHMFKLNVETLRNTCAGAVPKLLARGGGAIVNVGALSAREGQAQMGAYCAAKSCVMRLTESMARELRHHNVNVNAVLPSIIDTPTNRADMPDADFSKWVAPEKLAKVICFLGSDAAAAVHGALLPVQGLA
jgi:NAD(P)-dependent dehydrogenase (short-subunit alcohol dehydrogenase family)